MITFYIIAAGNGSRLGSDIPKALYPINGMPNIVNTIHHIRVAAERTAKEVRIVVVCSNKRVDAFKKTVNDVTLCPISSGLGDGHAVLATLEYEYALSDMTDEAVVIWGDAVVSYTNIGLLEEILKFELGENCMALPVVMEKDPYVSILVESTNDKCVSADFSKMGEHHPSGFHDQCIFKIRSGRIMQHLKTLHSAYWKNGRYTTETRELTFLYLIHYLYNINVAAVAYQTDYRVHSFNTVEEAKQVEKHA